MSLYGSFNSGWQVTENPDFSSGTIIVQSSYFMRKSSVFIKISLKQAEVAYWKAKGMAGKLGVGAIVLLIVYW